MHASRVFRNGQVFDGRRLRCAAMASRVADGRVARRRTRGRPRRPRRPGHRGRRPCGRAVLPGFQDAHVHPVSAGVERARCDLTDLGSAEEYLVAVKEYAAANPDRPLGPRWWLVDAGVRSDGTAGRPTSTRSCRTARCSCPTATITAPGSTPSRCGWRASTRRLPTRPTVASSATRRARRAGPCTRARWSWCVDRIPATTDAEYDVGLQLAQGYLHSLGVTAWQDAILGEYAGSGDPASAYLRAVEADALTVRVRGALWWERDRGLEQVEHLLDRRKTLTARSPRRRHVKVMQDGVAENYTAAMSRPYRDARGQADRQQRSVVPRARSCSTWPSPGWTPKASRSMFTPSGTGRSRRHSTPSRPPGRRTGRRRGATTSPTCSSSHRRTARASRTST